MSDEAGELVQIGAAARIVGRSTRTLERWVESGDLTEHRTERGHRYFLLSELLALRPAAGAPRALRPTDNAKAIAQLEARVAALESMTLIVTKGESRVSIEPMPHPPPPPQSVIEIRNPGAE